MGNQINLFLESFLSLIIIVLTGVSYYMYKRSDVPAPLSNDRVGYNTFSY